MEFKGTKGNWEVKRKLNVVVGTQPLCDAWSFGDICSEEASYNAKLISCALEMLEMLDLLTTVYSADNIEKAKLLIKKATTI